MQEESLEYDQQGIEGVVDVGIVAPSCFDNPLREERVKFLRAVLLDYAAVYDIESWDGYLIAIAKKFGARVVYSMDHVLSERLKEQKEAGLTVVVNPFTTRKVGEYHKFLEKKKA